MKFFSRKREHSDLMDELLDKAGFTQNKPKARKIKKIYHVSSNAWRDDDWGEMRTKDYAATKHLGSTWWLAGKSVNELLFSCHRSLTKGGRIFLQNKIIDRHLMITHDGNGKAYAAIRSVVSLNLNKGLYEFWHEIPLAYFQGFLNKRSIPHQLETYYRYEPEEKLEARRLQTLPRPASKPSIDRITLPRSPSTGIDNGTLPKTTRK